MKKEKFIRLTTLALICVLCSLLCVGCIPQETPAGSVFISYQIGSDATEYKYGDEITIEVFFTPRNYETEKYTYLLKIKESPNFEIIGNSEVYAERALEGEKFIGKSGYKHDFKATFKIKITEPCEEKCPVEVFIKCVDNDWLEHVPLYEDAKTDDPEFPFKTWKEFGFVADEDGIHFSKTVHNYF